MLTQRVVNYSPRLSGAEPVESTAAILLEMRRQLQQTLEKNQQLQHQLDAATELGHAQTQKIETLQQEKAALQDELAKAQATIIALTQERDALASKLQQANNELNSVGAKHKRAVQRYHELRKQDRDYDTNWKKYADKISDIAVKYSQAHSRALQLQQALAKSEEQRRLQQQTLSAWALRIRSLKHTVEQQRKQLAIYGPTNLLEPQYTIPEEPVSPPTQPKC